MNIAILNYYGKTDRGVEIWARELATHSKIASYSIFFSEKPVQQDRSKLSILQRFFIDKASILIGLWTMRVMGDLSGYDCIIPTNGGWQSILIRIYSIIMSKKVIIVGHSGMGWDDRVNLYTFPDAFIALSQNNRKWSSSVNPWVKMETIPNGVDLKLFANSGSKISLPFKGKTILWVGALTDSKKPLLTIKAVSKLKDVNLLMVGKGELEAEVLRVGELSMGSRFILKSFPWEEMPSVYRSCDVFTLASDSSESFGIVFLEAIASGLPVVTQDFPTRREICGDNAYYFAPNELDSYVEKLELALSKKMKVKINKEEFSWNKIATKYEDLLKKILYEE
jgi:glycosyltransferase involved in cell wall biosynthesis